MSTIYTPPSAIAIMAAALEAAPAIRKRWTENSQRSTIVKSAFEAMQAGEYQDCANLLGSLVDKSEPPELSAPKLPAPAISKAEPDRARLVKLHDALLAKRAQLRQLTGAGKHNIGGHELPHAPGEARREALQLRLDRLKAKVNARRNPRRDWQPLAQEAHHERL